MFKPNLSTALPPVFVRALLPLFVLFLLPGFARAQCDDKKTTIDINVCLAAELKKADAELHLVFQVKIKKLAAADAARLRKAQRAWIAYRDAHCDAEAGLYAGGTIAPSIQLGCRVNLTQLRTKEIETAYEEY